MGRRSVEYGAMRDAILLMLGVLGRLTTSFLFYR
jgi:hypothetical protein